MSLGGHIDSAENAQQEEDGSPSNEPNAERLRSHGAIPRVRKCATDAVGRLVTHLFEEK